MISAQIIIDSKNNIIEGDLQCAGGSLEEMLMAAFSLAEMQKQTLEAILKRECNVKLRKPKGAK